MLSVLPGRLLFKGTVGTFRCFLNSLSELDPSTTVADFCQRHQGLEVPCHQLKRSR